MKNFKKINEVFICEECGKTYNKIYTLSKHIGMCHNKKEYYDKWLKEENDGLCKICGKETEFTGFKKFYKNCCSNECLNQYIYNQTEVGCLKIYGVKNVFQSNKIKEKLKQTCLKKYGVEHSLQSEEIRNKGKHTCLKKYGVEHSLQSEEIRNKGKQTCLKKYGDEKYTNRKKSQETCYEHYGVKNPLQNEQIKKQVQETNLKKYGYTCLFKNTSMKQTYFLNKYGVVHPSQVYDFFIKAQKNGKKLVKYNDNIYYRGSYELDFLEKFYNKYPDIINASHIKYTHNKKIKIYFPDFYIPSLNLIIEIKNSYLAERDKNIIKLKKKAALNSGYNYIMIVDKDYTKLNKILSNGTTTTL